MAERVDFVGNKEELADFEVKFMGILFFRLTISDVLLLVC